MTPFAIQPGQVLTPENCAVALRVDGPLGAWVGTWRPAERRVRHLPAPEGWLAGSGLWTAEGVLRLPYATAQTPCGVAELNPPGAETATEEPAESPAPEEPEPPQAPRPVPLREAPLGQGRHTGSGDRHGRLDRAPGGLVRLSRLQDDHVDGECFR